MLVLTPDIKRLVGVAPNMNLKELIKNPLSTGSKTLMGRNQRMDGSGQEDLRNKVDYVVSRLKQDAHQGEFNRKLNAHALYFQDVALAEDVTPHFMCEPGSILFDKECGM